MSCRSLESGEIIVLDRLAALISHTTRLQAQTESFFC